MKLTNWVLALTICANSAYAINLEDQRANAKIYSAKDAQDANAEVGSLILNLRKKLGTENNVLPASIKALIKNPANNNTENRLSFSASIKRFINKSAERLSIAEKYQAPVKIDSAVSISKFRQQKKEYESSISLIDIAKDADELTTGLVTLAERDRAETKPEKAAEVSKLEVGKEILAYIEKAPQYFGKQITRLIGELTSVEIVDGNVREIHFSRAGVTIEFSLSMLATLRSGEDLNYIKALEHTIDYFNEQNFIFQKRLEVLDSPLAAAIEQKVNHLIETLKTYEVSDWEIKKAIATSENPDVIYSRKLSKFLEGKTFANAASEKEFLQKRINRIRSFMPYLHKQYDNSIRVHNRLVKLTVEQQNYLIDLFLQLQGKNILVSTDSVTIEKQLKANKALFDNDAFVSIEYGRLIADQINNLSIYLDYEKVQKQSRIADQKVLTTLAK
jgi:hypothetical protein